MCNSDARHQRQEKADLQSIAKDNCKHLSAYHKQKLLQFLINESLFYGTLYDWKTKPVSFQAKEENTSP